MGTVHLGTPFEGPGRDLLELAVGGRLGHLLRLDTVDPSAHRGAACHASTGSWDRPTRRGVPEVLGSAQNILTSNVRESS